MSGTCLAWSSMRTNALMVKSFWNGRFTNLNVPSIYQLLALLRCSSCWSVARMMWHFLCFLMSAFRKSSKVWCIIKAADQLWQGKFINTWKNVCSNKPQKAYKQHNKILLALVHDKWKLNLVYALSTRLLCQTKRTQDAITTRAYRRVEVKFIGILLEFSF